MTLLQQGSKLGSQGATKGMNMGNVWWAKNINDFHIIFARACQDHTFAARIQMGTPRNNQGNENGKWVMGGKNINNFQVNFARACQDHTFAARNQIGTPRDSQRNENGKCLMGRKTWTTFMWILRAPVRITLLLQGSKLGPQGTTKGMKMGNVWWVEKQRRLLCDFCAHLSGSHFCCNDPNWDPKGKPKDWRWKMSDGQKT